MHGNVYSRAYTKSKSAYTAYTAYTRQNCMTSLKAVTRKPRIDGLYPVYIRVVHNRKPAYIKTDKIVDAANLTPKGEIKDPMVNEHCARIIRRYSERLNKVDASMWSVKEVVEYLSKEDEEVCFSEYAKKHIANMENKGQMRTAKNYKLAVAHLERYLGTNRVMFGHLTSAVLTKWIETLEQTTARAKEMYPTCIRQIFKAAIIEFNDEEKNLIRIKFNPWPKIQIPKSTTSVQRAISAEACREFFNRPLPQTKMLSSLPELGRDVALLVLCLGGINTVDLFEMKKENYKDGVIGYKRAKTRHSRKDEAYMEMRVEPFIKATFDKYLAPEDDEYLFTFHRRYCDSDSFCANVNNGIRKICADMGMAKEDYYCVYTFRHTWATIAQNDCDANLYEVAFGMNHTHGFSVTRGYIRMDFSPAWKLNAKVIDFVFFSTEKSKRGIAKDLEATSGKLFRLSPKKMVYARAYFKGKILAELTDIGFANVDAVIKALAKLLPSDLADGCTVHFRITDCDSQMEEVYPRSKGKGF